MRPRVYAPPPKQRGRIPVPGTPWRHDRASPRFVLMPVPSALSIRTALSRDPILARIIAEVGPLPRKTPASASADLAAACRIIAGQQLSAKAASTIWTRVIALAPAWEPAAVAELTEQQLCACGLSRNKASFIRGLAGGVTAGTLDFSAIRRMDDVQASTALSALKGFGPWSIEMFLMFSLDRPDLFSRGDAGLRRAICLLYSVAKDEYEHHVEGITAPWRPYRSYACRYLWAWLDQQ